MLTTVQKTASWSYRKLPVSWKQPGHFPQVLLINRTFLLAELLLFLTISVLVYVDSMVKNRNKNQETSSF